MLIVMDFETVTVLETVTVVDGVPVILLVREPLIEGLPDTVLDCVPVPDGENVADKEGAGVREMDEVRDTVGLKEGVEKVGGLAIPLGRGAAIIGLAAVK